MSTMQGTVRCFPAGRYEDFAAGQTEEPLFPHNRPKACLRIAPPRASFLHLAGIKGPDKPGLTSVLFSK